MEGVQQILHEIRHLSEKVDKLNTAVVGDEEYGYKGIIDRVQEIEQKQSKHEDVLKKAKIYVAVVSGITSLVALIMSYYKSLWQ